MFSPSHPPTRSALACHTAHTAAGRYLFMHNGVVAGFMQIRRALLAGLSDAAYNAVQSFHSDSAVRCGASCCGSGWGAGLLFWLRKLL